jgi:hypothetical protein
LLGLLLKEIDWFEHGITNNKKADQGGAPHQINVYAPLFVPGTECCNRSCQAAPGAPLAWKLEQILPRLGFPPFKRGLVPHLGTPLRSAALPPCGPPVAPAWRFRILDFHPMRWDFNPKKQRCNSTACAAKMAMRAR